MSTSKDEEDRISALPGHVRQHILSFLDTKDAKGTSLLSWTWRYDWLRVSCVDLGEDFLPKGITKNESYAEDLTLQYLEFIDRAVIKNNDKVLTIRKIALYLPALVKLNEEIDSCLRKMKNVEELKCKIYGACAARDAIIPKCVLATPSITQLHGLGCTLPKTMSSQLNLPNLRELDLYSVNIEQVMMESIIMKCTSILTLRLELCRGFNSLRISGIPALKDLYLCDNLELTMTEIDAPNLEELHYEPTEIFNLVLTAKSFRMRYLELSHSEVISPSDWIRSNISTHLSHIKELVLHGSNVLEHIARTGIEMACLERLEIGSQQGPLSPDMGQIRLQSLCVNLKHLELEYYRSDVTDDWLNQQIAQLTNLESLKIKSFNSVVHLIICHMRLTTLSLLHLEKLEKVDIDCPNLRTFSYDVSYRETIMSLTTASSQLTALTSCEIFLGSTKLPSDKVLQLLEKLKHSRYMTLHVFDQSLQDIVNWRRMKDSFRIHRPPLSEANISLQLVFPKCTLSKQQVDNIFEFLLRLCPQPHVIRLQSYSTSTVEYNYEDETVLENLVVGCSCFDSCLGRCWQHSCISNEIIEEPVSEIVAERTGFGTGEPSNKRKADVDCYPSSLKHYLKH